MLTIKNLTVAYGEKKVINNLNLELGCGKIHGLVGLNGAGKTTFLNTIFGTIKAQSGEIFINDKKLTKKDIAFLEAENFFYAYMTAYEYLSLFENKAFELEKWNEIFELPLHTLVENYSTGMKKKLALLAILKLNKPIIILDEPFNGLDLETCKIVQLIISKLGQSQKTVIITSHILESLTAICDEIHYLESGIIKFSKMPNEFLSLENDIFMHFNKKELIDKLL